MASFWSEQDIEPKRTNRWLLRIGNLPTFLVLNFTKPSLSVSNSSFQELNNIRYKPTIAKWEPCRFSVSDVEKGKGLTNSTKALLSVFRGSGYEVFSEPKQPNRDEIIGDDPTSNIYETGGESFSNILKKNSVSSLGNVRFEQLNVDGKKIEEWTLHQAWLESCDFGGEASYEDEKLVVINGSIRYDYATYKSF